MEANSDNPETGQILEWASYMLIDPTAAAVSDLLQTIALRLRKS